MIMDMRLLVGKVALKDRPGGWPRAEQEVQQAILCQNAMRGIVQNGGNAPLMRADHDYRERIKPPAYINHQPHKGSDHRIVLNDVKWAMPIVSRKSLDVTGDRSIEVMVRIAIRRFDTFIERLSMTVHENTFCSILKRHSVA